MSKFEQQFNEYCEQVSSCPTSLLMFHTRRSVFMCKLGCHHRDTSEISFPIGLSDSPSYINKQIQTTGSSLFTKREVSQLAPILSLVMYMMFILCSKQIAERGTINILHIVSWLISLCQNCPKNRSSFSSIERSQLVVFPFISVRI